MQALLVVATACQPYLTTSSVSPLSLHGWRMQKQAVCKP